MAEENKKFDAVLGGFLVNDLRARAERLHCPEPEVLAAYHERALLPEEMNSWKEHIVGCAHCQAILAELEATESIPLQAREKEEALLMSLAERAAGVTSKDRSVEAAALPEKPRITRISRGALWQWLVPAGALAAGLLVWVAWHENQPPQRKGPAETAKLEQPSTPMPPVPQRVYESTSSDKLANLAKDQGAAGGIASAKTAPASESLKRLEKPESRTNVVPAKPSAGKERAPLPEATRDSSGAVRPENQPDLDAKSELIARAEDELKAQTPSANAPAQNQQNQLNTQKVAGPAPLGQAQGEVAKKAKSAPAASLYRSAVPSAPPTPSPVSALRDKASMQVAGISNAHLIAAPGAGIFWLAGRAGLIAFSSDNGASWSRQTSGVQADLTTGSAPSAKTCWIVGRAGTILLTTDGGAHWSVIHSPVEEDLGGVRATDALHAAIWNSANTKTFETTDGGVTWKSASPQ